MHAYFRNGRHTKTLLCEMKSVVDRYRSLSMSFKAVSCIGGHFRVRNGGHTNSLFILKLLSGLQDPLCILAGTIGGKLDVYSI